MRLRRTGGCGQLSRCGQVNGHWQVNGWGLMFKCEYNIVYSACVMEELVWSYT